MSRCKAIVTSGARKGSRCKYPSKYGGYCGLHKSLLVAEARNATKDERLALITAVGVSLISLMEKAIDHLPDAIEVISHFMGFPGPMYPERDPLSFNQLMEQWSLKKRIARSKIIADAKNAVFDGKSSTDALKNIAILYKNADSEWEDREEIGQLFELLWSIDSIDGRNSS